ncbi:MAG: lysophospholipid acyltransferase family protein [Campylobacterales bacterium]|nr:lysophospholipid acyltransferase family protein [Campylobacterales bacterium]
MFSKSSRKKFFRRVTLLVVPFLIYTLMRLLWLTYRKRYHFLSEPIEGQLVAVSWHSELLISPQMYRRLRPKILTSAIISQHFDGDIVAKVLAFFTIYPLRGSSNKGAKSVLINSLKALKEGHSVLLTPDGPRGPRYSMNDGAVALAMKSQLPIVAINYRPQSYWQLSSWDKFLIPKPFSALDIYYEVISLNTRDKEEAKTQLQAVMNRNSL